LGNVKKKPAQAITGVNEESESFGKKVPPTPGPAPLPPAFIPTSATSTTTQQGVDLPFGSQEFLSSSEQARAALLAQAKAKAAQAQQEAAVALQAPAERDAIAADADAARADVESQISRVQADLARMTAEAERETPPPRLSLGQQADLERAAEAAGRAMGFMMQGGANPALVIADRLINQQIQQQKGRAAGKARIRAEKRSFLATLTARLGREDAAEALAYKRLAANQADMLKGIAASSQDPVLKAGAEVTAAQLEQRAMQAGNQAAAMMADRTTTTTKRGQMVNPFAVAAAKAAAKGGAPTEKTIRFALREVDAMKKLFANPLVAGGTLTKSGNEYDLKRKAIGITLWKLFDKGRLSEGDVRMALGTFFPPAYKAALPGFRGGGLSRFDSLKNYLASRLRDTATSPVAPPSQAQSDKLRSKLGVPKG
jgi:hypothetical protein